MSKASFASFVILGLLLLGALVLSTVGITTPSEAAGGSQMVPNSELIRFLPDAPSGWNRQIDEWSIAEGTYNVSTNYSSETIDAYVIISDHGIRFSEQEFWDRLPEPEGEIKSVTVNGFQAREEYVQDFNYYILLVNIHNRFLVVITTARDRETLYYFADSIDYNELATLGETINGGEIPGFEFGFVIIAVFALEYIVRKSRKGSN
jgi:hypothetical protein